MKFYSQKDLRWNSKKIGLSNISFGEAGCLLTSLANHDAILHGGIGRTPLQIMDIFMTAGAIDPNGMTTVEVGVKALNMKYLYSKKKPTIICLAETDCFFPKVPQHFFLLDPKTSKIIDPLDLMPDWKEKPTKYNIVSFRSLWYA